MKFTKHAHACVALDEGASHLLIDPGNLTPDAAALIAATDTVLITHEHPDHFDEKLLAAALSDRPELTVFGPAAVVDRWSARPGQVRPVRDGDHFKVGGFGVSVHGELHAPIHADFPQVANVGYLVDDAVYHPGDAYYAPPTDIETLLVPTSGPWTKLGEAVDFIRSVGPRQILQIHESMLSTIGQQHFARFLSPMMLSKVPLKVVPVGDTIDL